MLILDISKLWPKAWKCLLTGIGAHICSNIFSKRRSILYINLVVSLFIFFFFLVINFPIEFTLIKKQQVSRGWLGVTWHPEGNVNEGVTESVSEEKGVTYRDEAHLKIQQDRKLHYKQLRNKWLQARKQEEVEYR